MQQKQVFGVARESPLAYNNRTSLVIKSTQPQPDHVEAFFIPTTKFILHCDEGFSNVLTFHRADGDIRSSPVWIRT